MKTPAKKAYQRRTMLALAAYFPTFAGTYLFVTHVRPCGVALVACAVLPFLPLFAVFVMTGQYLAEERDEFGRDLVVRCLLWGAGASLSANVFLGYLRIFGFPWQAPPFVELVAFSVAAVAAGVSYRMANRLPAE
jgi:hypothetical protein